MRKIFIINLILSLLSACATLPAIAAEIGQASASDVNRECRKAIIIYLDVSGSMYDQTIRTPGRTTSIPLITAMTDVLDRLLADRTNSIVEDNDLLMVRGFYSKTADIFSRVERFDFWRDSEVIKKSLQELVQPVRKGMKKLSDANPNQKFREGGGQDSFKTNFLSVLSDMDTQSRNVALTGVDGYRKLIFLVITDGDHDYSSMDEYRQKAETAVSQRFKDAIGKNEISVYFVGVGDYYRQNASRVNTIRSDFETRLKAIDKSIVSEQLDPEYFKQIFKSHVPGSVQITGISINKDNYSPEASAEKKRTLEFNATVYNDYCQPVKVSKITWKLKYAQHKDLEGQPIPEQLAKNSTKEKIIETIIEPKVKNNPAANIPVSFSYDELPYGKYELTVEAKLFQNNSTNSVSETFEINQVEDPVIDTIFNLLPFILGIPVIVIVFFYLLRSHKRKY